MCSFTPEIQSLPDNCTTVHTALYCTALYSSHYTVLYCTAQLTLTVLHCAVHFTQHCQTLTIAVQFKEHSAQCRGDKAKCTTHSERGREHTGPMWRDLWQRHHFSVYMDLDMEKLCTSMSRQRKTKHLTWLIQFICYCNQLIRCNEHWTDNSSLYMIYVYICWTIIIFF